MAASRVSGARLSPVLVGIVSGILAALFWGAGIVVGRHGLDVGLTPAEMALHRFLWVGLGFLPFVIRDRFAALDGIGWRRAIMLTIFGGPPMVMLSYVGFYFAPLGHGAVIQPSSSALGGLLLATLVLREPLPVHRLIGALIIVCGLGVFGAEAFTTLGSRAVLGDLIFVFSGSIWTVFGLMLKKWNVSPTRGVIVMAVISLVDLPIHWLVFGFDPILAAGFTENLLQALVQGVLAGSGAIFLYARSVLLLGAGRAAIFPALVPMFTLLIGYFTIGNVPSVLQLVGLAIVVVGFRFAMK